VHQDKIVKKKCRAALFGTMRPAWGLAPQALIADASDNLQK